jgi:phosphotransferase system enzyme I (PtsI)
MEVTICGEMAAEPLYLLVLIGMGYTHLSMNAASIPKIKSMIRKSTYEQSKALADKVTAFASHKQAHKFVTQRMQEWFPEYF